MMVEITIWDEDGNVVVREEVDAPTATDVQISDMISLIEGGCPPHIAAHLAMTTPYITLKATT